MNTLTIGRPLATEHNPYFARYIDRNPEGDVMAALDNQINEALALLRAIPESKGGHRYAPGKWSIREVIGHVIDSERVFGYRALRFARGDTTPLPGFEENVYAPASGADRRTIADLAAEYETARRSHRMLFAALDEEAWLRSGVANENPISVRALAWIMAGHGRHHAAVLQERYL